LLMYHPKQPSVKIKRHAPLPREPCRSHAHGFPDSGRYVARLEPIFCGQSVPRALRDVPASSQVLSSSRLYVAGLDFFGAMSVANNSWCVHESDGASDSNRSDLFSFVPFTLRPRVLRRRGELAGNCRSRCGMASYAWRCVRRGCPEGTPRRANSCCRSPVRCASCSWRAACPPRQP